MLRGRGSERRPELGNGTRRFVCAARHGWRTVLRVGPFCVWLRPTSRRLRLRSAALDFREGLSCCREEAASLAAAFLREEPGLGGHASSATGNWEMGSGRSSGAHGNQPV
jgi:hypothetical protein